MSSDRYRYNLLGEGFARFTIQELKAILRANSLRVSGVRKVLIDRLEEKGVVAEELPEDKERGDCIELSKKHFREYNPEKETFKRWKCDTDFYPSFLTKEVARGLYNHILDHFELPSTLRRRYNKTYGDDGLVYRIKFGGYAGRPEVIVERRAEKWTDIPMLRYVRDLIQSVTGATFTYCVVQYYPNGKVGIKPHKDKEMLPGTMIAGLSLGQTRMLTLESYNDSFSIPLYSGSLYVFKPPTNDRWMHSIEKDDTISPRLSLTFRNLPPEK